MVSNSINSEPSHDYEKLGFRAGLEIHAQIKSKRKLFCHCKPIRTPPRSKPDYTFERRFRPVLGEMGDYDVGMLIEFEKDYRVRYYTFREPYGICTYEMDETPPFFPDQEAIDVGFYLAHYYNCQSLVDELIFNRKQYLDGSITTGFQRTAVLGRDGWILVNNRKIRISNFNVEEDAARRVDFNDRTDRAVFFNLDRLSIPLVEIITNHEDCRSCQDLHDLALLLGLGLRITGKGVRGIGSIRQDVNISINRGNRVELKGVQNITMLQTYVDREIQRQLALIELMDELKGRGVQESDFEHYYIDVHDPVDKIGDLTKSNEWIAFAVRLPKCRGLLSREVQPGKPFALEIFDKAELISGLPTAQMFHSDDSPTWMKENNANEVFKRVLGLQEEDAFILAVGEPNRVIHTLKKIIERMKLALKGVPQETRRVLPNGNSEFLRVIHGKDRLYPDTDTEGIPIAPERLKRILSKYQPPKPWDLVERSDLTLVEVSLIAKDEILLRLFCNLIEKYEFSSRKAFGIIQKVRRFRKSASVSSLHWEKVIAKLRKWLGSGEYPTQEVVVIIELLAGGWNEEQIENLLVKQSAQLQHMSDFIAKNANRVWEEFRNNAESPQLTKRSIRRMMYLIKRSFRDISPQRAANLVLEYWITWRSPGG